MVYDLSTVRHYGFQTKLLGITLVMRSIGWSRALAQADSPAFYEMAKRRAQPGCFAPPSQAFWRAWAAAGPAICNPINVIRTQW